MHVVVRRIGDNAKTNEKLGEAVSSLKPATDLANDKLALLTERPTCTGK